MTDDTLVLFSSIKLLNKHLWGDEEEITIVDTLNFTLGSNRLNSFFGWGKDKLKTPRTFYQWEFWQFVCGRLKEEIQEEIKRLLEQFPRHPELGFSFWLFCTVVWLFALPYDSHDNKPGGGILDPPIIFTPIPGIEIGGCARSDSTTAPVI
ncbi:MAG TPA: hypothetical protein DCS91_12825 [Microcoleaceae bacterium UBA11344]|nr:hypothetical protein [Microcoleaceae cyanobacterium UBA11344]